ncbi:MAG: DUF5060 domain-containing protein [Bacteroidota bacterium]
MTIYTRFSLFIAFFHLLLASSTLIAQTTYQETDGLLVIEMENAAELNGWEITNTIGGASGSGYIHWTDGQFLNQTGNGPLLYRVQINTPGTYRFEWRVAVGFGTNSTEHNDSWLKINGSNFYALKNNSQLQPKPQCNNSPDYGCPNGSSTNGFFKIYGGGVNSFQWAARTSDNDAHQIYADFDQPGIYDIEVNARSTFHAIDRLILYHSSVSQGDARNLNNPESPTLTPPTDGELTISGELRQWHRVALTFEGPSSSETATPNPFTDYNLEVTFTKGDKTYIVPGFFAADGNAAETSATSGDQWRVYFAPDEVGTWNYSVSFKTGSNVAIDGGGTSAGFMDGQSGTIEILPTNKTGRDNRGRGRLEYVGEHYLQYAGTGEWFVKAGADAPENTLAYEDFDAVPNAGNRRKSWQPHQQDYDAGSASVYTWQDGKGTELLGVINYLANKEVNAFSFLTFNVEGDDRNVFPHLLIGSPEDYNGNGQSWEQEIEHLRFDVSRMAQWERIFAYADLRGMFLHFKTQETENDQLMDGGDVDLERKLYYRELIARFGHHLALNWNMGEENTQTTQQRRDMADYFAETDPYNHLRVIHTYPGQKDQVYTPLLGDNSAYTGASLQTGNGNQQQTHPETADWVEASAAADQKWVIAVDEPGNASIGVDSDPDDRKLTRHRVVWGNFMAGGAGTEFYYGYQSGCGDLLCEDHRSRDQKYTDAAFALDFFQLHFQPYLPNVVNANSLTPDNNDYVLTNPGVAYAVYRPDGGSTTIDLPAGEWQLRWYNPRNGELGALSSFDNNTLVAPDNNDWTALITLGNCTAGTACDDGDDCTVNDSFDEDCNCSGTIADADEDGVCDEDDQCPGQNDNLDEDNDGIPDGCDDCNGNLAGTSCDDGNPETTNDVFDANCICAGQAPPAPEEYWLEAECADYGEQWGEFSDLNASGGVGLQSFESAAFLDNPPSGAEHLIRFNLEVINSDTYVILARVLALEDGDDSFWVRVNEGEWLRWNKINFPYSEQDWVWEQAGNWTNGDEVDLVSFDLAAGLTTIDFVHREPNAKLDKIVLRVLPTPPVGTGAAAQNCAINCAGQACDDGNSCTANDSFDDSCNCIGTLQDSDNDGVCDAEDQCPGQDDNLDADQDGIPDGCDACDANQAGTACDDGDQSTRFDALTNDCNCEGQGVPTLKEYWLEAECASLGAFWSVANLPAASLGELVRSPQTQSFPDSPPADAAFQVRFQLSVPDDGGYAIFARLKAASAENDAFWVRVNNGEWMNWNKINYPYTDQNFNWHQVGQWDGEDASIPVAFTFLQGMNTIDFVYQDAGIDLDKLFVTHIPEAPTGFGDLAVNCQITSVEDLDYADVKLFPNPTSGQFQLTGWDGPESKFSLLDLHGRVARTFPPSAIQGRRFDLSGLANGVYLFQLENEGQVRQWRIVKQ